MRPILENLFRLHQLDASIKSLEEARSGLPAELAAIESVAAEAEAGLASVRDKRQDLEKARRALEQQVEDAGQAIKKHQRQVFEVKTNKEYTAMLHEIDGEKRRVSEMEERILAMMEEADALAAAERQAADRSGAVRLESDGRRAEHRARAGRVEADLAAASAARKELLEGLPQDVLSHYQRVFRGRNGVAVVPIVGSACGGCFANLPTKVAVEVHAMEELITCEACGRILVWGPGDGAAGGNDRTHSDK